MRSTKYWSLSVCLFVPILLKIWVEISYGLGVVKDLNNVRSVQHLQNQGFYSRENVMPDFTWNKILFKIKNYRLQVTFTVRSSFHHGWVKTAEEASLTELCRFVYCHNYSWPITLNDSLLNLKYISGFATTHVVVSVRHPLTYWSPHPLPTS